MNGSPTRVFTFHASHRSRSAKAIPVFETSCKLHLRISKAGERQRRNATTQNLKKQSGWYTEALIATQKRVNDKPA